METRWIRVRRGSGVVQAREVPAALCALMAGANPPDDFASNGCGPKIAPPFEAIIHAIVPQELHDWPLWIACHWHDYAYQIGGGWHERRVADFNLARNIVTVIAEARVPSLSAVRVFFVADTYWTGVRIGGPIAWNYRDSEPMSSVARAARTVVVAPVVAKRLIDVVRTTKPRLNLRAVRAEGS